MTGYPTAYRKGAAPYQARPAFKDEAGRGPNQSTTGTGWDFASPETRDFFEVPTRTKPPTVKDAIAEQQAIGTYDFSEEALAGMNEGQGIYMYPLPAAAMALPAVMGTGFSSGAIALALQTPLRWVGVTWAGYGIGRFMENPAPMERVGPVMPAIALPPPWFVSQCDPVAIPDPAYPFGPYFGGPGVSCNVGGQAGPYPENAAHLTHEGFYGTTGHVNQLQMFFTREAVHHRYMWQWFLWNQAIYDAAHPAGPGTVEDYSVKSRPKRAAPGVKAGKLPYFIHEALQPIGKVKQEADVPKFRDRASSQDDLKNRVGDYDAIGAFRVPVGSRRIANTRVRPGVQNHERKVLLTGQAARIMHAFRGTMNVYTESADMVQALWEALPKHLRHTGWTPDKKGGKPSRPHLDQMLKDLYAGYRELDVQKAARNVVSNQIKDMLIGKVSGTASRDMARHVGSPIGPTFGPAL